MAADGEMLTKDEVFVGLVQRVFAGRCALFLGAGASVSSGAPTAPELATLIARDVLKTDLPGYGLADVVDFADGTTGRRSVTEAIANRLDALVPSAHLRQLCALPWKSIYTVNFDDLVEKSFNLDRPGELRVFTSTKELERADASGTTLYMLHGSYRQPLDRDMGLVLTQDDFIKSDVQRRSFYHRLTDDMQAVEVVYVGFSMVDQDFRRVISDLHNAVEGRLQLLPRGYAVMPDPPALARNFWDTKKISLISATMETAVEAIGRIRSGKAESKAVSIGSTPMLPRFLAGVHPVAAEAEEYVRAFDFPGLDNGEPDASTFLRGGPISWPTIRERFDAARSVTDDLVGELLVAPAGEPRAPSPGSARFVLLGGYAGSGKTTIAKRAAWELANTWGRAVVWLRHPSRLQLDLVEGLTGRSNERVYVFVDDAADSALQVVDVIRRARRRGLRLTFVVSERANEWIASTRNAPLEPDRIFEIGALSNSEAESLLVQLERAGELGTLKGLSREQQIDRLLTRASRQLLVGLREATEDKKFDAIVEDELKSLPSDAARRSYLNVCTLFQFGVSIRAGVLSRTTGVPFEDFPERILRPSRGVILEEQSGPWEQPTYRARHRVIAEIIFRRAFRTAEDRATQVMALTQQLDLGYSEDHRAFSRLTSARWLRDNGIEDPSVVYALARRLRPDSAFVIQQEALSWRYRDPAQSAQLLQEAASLAPQSDAIQHSQALLVTDQAKRSAEPFRSQLFSHAEDAFRHLIKRDPTNSAAYVSLAGLLLARAESSDEGSEQLHLLADATRTIEIVFVRCPVTFHMLQAAAQVDSAAGRLSAAADEYRKAAEAAGPNKNVWINYARFLLSREGAPSAVAALNEALDMLPTDAALNYELARVLEGVRPIDRAAIKAAYGYAVAEPVRGYLPELDYAIFLHKNGEVDEAAEHFSNLRALPIPHHLKTRARSWVLEGGARKVFEAEVADIRLSSAYLLVPTFDERVFIDPAVLPSELRAPHRRMAVNVMYNCFGPRAVPARTVMVVERDAGEPAQ